MGRPGAHFRGIGEEAGCPAVLVDDFSQVVLKADVPLSHRQPRRRAVPTLIDPNAGEHACLRVEVTPWLSSLLWIVPRLCFSRQPPLIRLARVTSCCFSRVTFLADAHFFSTRPGRAERRRQREIRDGTAEEDWSAHPIEERPDDPEIVISRDRLHTRRLGKLMFASVRLPPRPQRLGTLRLPRHHAYTPVFAPSAAPYRPSRAPAAQKQPPPLLVSAGVSALLCHSHHRLLRRWSSAAFCKCSRTPSTR